MVRIIWHLNMSVGATGGVMSYWQQTFIRPIVAQVNGPSVYRTYLAAAQRLGLSEDASGYWELHIREDERHGRQMVEDVAVKLVDMCASGLLLICREGVS